MSWNFFRWRSHIITGNRITQICQPSITSSTTYQTWYRQQVAAFFPGSPSPTFKMAEYALLRAMNQHTSTIIGIPQRVASKNIVDKMEAIPEDSGSSRRSSINGDVESVASIRTFTYSEKSPLLAKQKRPSTDEKLRKAITALLSILAVVSSAMQTISIPMYVHSMTASRAGSDPYIASFLAAMWPPAIFFVLTIGINSAPGRTELTCGPPAPLSHLFLAGLLAGLNTVLVAATSLPERTPTYLQSILSHSLIPFSAICRAIILRKGMRKNMHSVPGSKDHQAPSPYKDSLS